MNVPGIVAVLVTAAMASMLLLWRRTRLAGGLALAVVLGFCIVNQRREARFVEGFAHLRQGASYADVVDRMGTPSATTDGTLSVYGDAKGPTELTEGCTRELWYHRFWFPERYAVCLDASGVVLAKHQYFSW